MMVRAAALGRWRVIHDRQAQGLVDNFSERAQEPMPLKMIDLTTEQFEGNCTHPVHGRTPLMFPGTGSHALTRRWGLKNPYDGSSLSVANEHILITGHTGTHVDAPFHVDPQGASVEKVPCERAAGDALWLDLSSMGNSRALIEPLDLERAEREGAEQIRPSDIVLVHTGWLDGAGDRSVKSYVEDAPALSRAAGEWLRARGIKALGVDLPTPDPHGASDLPIHMNFLRPRSIGLADQEYILIYENLTNIGRIPSRRFLFVGLPIPFRGASGSPVRAVALA
jgi:kynurenine formamidase